MEVDDAMFSEMDELEMDELFREGGDDKFSELGKQVCRMGLYLKAHNCPARLQPQLKELDDLLVHASLCQEDSVFWVDFVARCPLPVSNVFQWQSMLPPCLLLCGPWVSSLQQYARAPQVPCWTMHGIQLHGTRLQLKKKKLRKENKLRKREDKMRKREERIERLRKKERELKRIYDLQMLELQRAAAAAVKDGQGTQSNQDDVNKLLGDLSVLSCTRASQKMEEDGEYKDEVKK